MSELERERHKNVGLERARDSWYQEWFRGTERIAELEAEVGRLKVCIICDHCSGVDDSRWCDEEKPWDESVWLYDLCHYTPSRWTARAEEGSE